MFCCRKLLTCSKVTRPLIESHITALVIPSDLQTSKTVKTAVLFFQFNFILFDLLINYIAIITVNRSIFFPTVKVKHQSTHVQERYIFK